MKYKVWMEGFCCTGDYAQASFLGEYEADSFNDACEIAAKAKFSDMSLYRVTNDNPYYWGCQMFDNETDARKYFG